MGVVDLACSKITPESQVLIKAVMPTLKKLTHLALNLKLLCHMVNSKGPYERLPYLHD